MRLGRYGSQMRRHNDFVDAGNIEVISEKPVARIERTRILMIAISLFGALIVAGPAFDWYSGVVAILGLFGLAGVLFLLSKVKSGPIHRLFHRRLLWVSWADRLMTPEQVYERFLRSRTDRWERRRWPR